MNKVKEVIGVTIASIEENAERLFIIVALIIIAACIYWIAGGPAWDTA